MDRDAVSAQYLKAGESYLTSLRQLGLNPMFLGWGKEVASGDWVLGMVTSVVDAGGPLELNKLLFRAYNADATPREISPFIVRVYSPEIASPEFYALAGKKLTVMSENLAGTVDVLDMEFKFLGVSYRMINAYLIDGRTTGQKYQQRLREWTNFKRNIDKLAA